MSDDPCAPANCDWGTRKLAWCIPAGVLNSLWSDFFPRLVAVAWHDALVAPPARYLQPGDPPPLQGGTTATGLLDLLLWMRGKAVADEDPCKNTPGFIRRRLDAVIKFFWAHQAQTGKPFPIVVAGTGGYDFLLSDWGIEMFMPEAPPNAQEMLRYYAFRQTGRPSLGIPSYLTPSALSLISIDAPTGPSQIEVDAGALALVLPPECRPPEHLIEGWRMSTEEWDEMKARVRRWPDDAPALPNPEEIELGELHVCWKRDQYWHVFFGKWKRDPKRERPEDRPNYPREPEEPFRLNFDEYVCLVRKSRCWQVEGSVYRGFATELPRIVATAWMEPGGVGPYTAAFNDPGEKGLRELMRQRLETMLPRFEQMAFQEIVGSPPTLPNGEGVPALPRWNEGDVMVTDQGFYFPELSTAPDLETMIEEIAGGLAGNPVFTDSKRPNGG
jgi:hypothetical protein